MKSKKNLINMKLFAIFGALIILASFVAIPSIASARTYTYYNPAPFSGTNDDDYDRYRYNRYDYDYYDYNYSRSVVSAPYINSITPDRTTAGSRVINVTISGSGFVSDSIARWDDSPRKTAYMGSNRLVVELYAGDISSSGRHYITVTNERIGGGYSNPVPFVVNGSVASTTVSRNTSSLSASAYTAYQNVSNTNSSAKAVDESYGGLTANAIFGSNSFFPTGIVQWIIFIALVLAIVFIWRKFFGGERTYHSTPLKHA